MSLILASSSPSRQALLRRLGLAFETRPANVDETPRPGEGPAELAQRLSRAKANAVAALQPNALVIGCDQVAVCEGEISGKPGNANRAAELLASFSGKSLEFITGVALLGPGVNEYFADHTHVQFRRLEPGEIQRYIERDQPYDCAGAFRLESAAPMLFEAVRNEDPTALLGLPLILLCAALRRLGYSLP